MSDRRRAEAELVSGILERVRELARLRAGEEPGFVPGESFVRYAGRVYGESELVNLVDASLEFWLTGGRWHADLEDRLASWYGVRTARLVSSGSSANLLAVAALTSPTWGDRRLRRGDEVLTVAAGFPTTVAPIVQLGAVPVFVDVEPTTANVDVGALEAAVTERTRAVVLAHTLGNPFDLDAVSALCERHGLWLVEDNCDAAGSLYRGRKTGTFGDLATLSFYPPHHMTTGEGGAVLCRSAEMDRVLRSLRDWGRDCWCASGVDDTCRKRFSWKLGDLPSGYDHKYVYSHLGFNLRMTDLQAAVGCAQLDRLDGFCAARRANWQAFRSAFDDLEECFVLPAPTVASDPSWFGFLLTVREGAPFTRDEIVRHLEGRRIQTRMLFAGNLVRQPAFTRLRSEAPDRFRVAGPLVHTDALLERAFWIGVYPGLTSEARDWVAEQLRGFARGRLG